MRYKLTVHTIYEQGQRANQEDCIYPAKGKECDTDRLFILCDGMGGHESGEVASATVCAAISRSIFAMCPDAEGTFSDENLQAAITQAFDSLDVLEAQTSRQLKKMGTTMTCLKLHDKGCTIAHIGDSRVYHIRPGKSKEDTKILFVTEDHSLVNDLIKVGELTPAEARHSKQKNVITRAMQPNMERRPKADIYHTDDIRPGDYFYLCSDGMLEQEEYDNRYFLHNFSDETGDEDTKVRILTMATSQNSDNHSAIIVHITEVMGASPVADTNVTGTINRPTPIIVKIDDESSREENNKPDIPNLFNGLNLPPIVYRYGKQIRGCLLLLLFAFLLLLGTIFTLRKISKHFRHRPVNIETPRRPVIEPRQNSGRQVQRIVPQENLQKPNKDTAIAVPVPSSRPDSSAPVKDSLPAKVHNAISSHANQAGKDQSMNNVENDTSRRSDHQRTSTHSKRL